MGNKERGHYPSKDFLWTTKKEKKQKKKEGRNIINIPNSRKSP